MSNDHLSPSLTDTPKNSPSAWDRHQHELKHIATFCCGLFGFTLLPYTTPALADYRPWLVGEKIPIIGIWLESQVVMEDAQGALAIASLADSATEPPNPELPSPEQEPVQVLASVGPVTATPELSVTRIERPTRPDRTLGALPDRSPAVHAELLIPEGALDNYFESLALVEDHQPGYISRTLVWGDSTIANDGIITNIRTRFQDRFGDGGPGFLAAQVDPRWSMRKDILRKTSGWKTKTIIHGGAQFNRYGLAGTVSTTLTSGYSILGGLMLEPEAEGDVKTRQDLYRAQVFYQTQAEGGSFSIVYGDKEVPVNTKDGRLYDGVASIELGLDINKVRIQAHGNGPVTIYGTALETNGPGITWETLAVAGSSITSMRKQSERHLVEQINNRNPNLIVYWTGGNELGYPSVKTRKGKGYKKLYRKVIRSLKEGAPEASCLLIGPLDQGKRERGEIISKPTIQNIVRFQKEVAIEQGCAYLDAQALMGGNNSYGSWLNSKLASSDLLHLTRKGRNLIGETMADVLEREYDLWRIEHPNVAWEPGESIRDFWMVADLYESPQTSEDFEPTSIECAEHTTL